MSWAQTWTILFGVVAVSGVQAFWIARALDALRSEFSQRFDRVETRLDRIETVLRDHGDRIARLEGSHS